MTSSERPGSSATDVKAQELRATALAQSEALEWSELWRVAGVAALILLLYTLVTMVQLLVLGGQPGTATEAFNLLQHHRVVGLLRLDLPTIFILPLYYLLFLGFYTALSQTNRAQVLLGTSVAFVGVTLLLATPTALSMLPLSEKYAAATTESARAQFLAAGEAILAADIWHATGAIIGGVLLQCGFVLICVVMLRDNIFGRITAYLGIVMHGLDLAHLVFGILWPGAGFVLMAIAGPLYPIWFFLVGRRLLKLGSEGSTLRSAAATHG